MTDDTTLLANDNATRHATGDGEADVLVRRATADDLPLVIELDGDNTGLHKPDYWGETFHEIERHPRAALPDRPRARRRITSFWGSSSARCAPGNSAPGPAAGS